MSEFLSEKVPRMPPLSMLAIEEMATRALDVLVPAREPMKPLDLLTLVNKTLPRYGILTYPASDEEIGERLAATDPTGDAEIFILLASDLWSSFLAGGRRAHQARATIAHELGHAILHVPVVRRRMKSPLRDVLLNRVQRGTLKAFEDPEWQAWALAGCLLAPRSAIVMADTLDIPSLATTFGVSEGMMQSHMKRLKLERRF